MGTAGDPHRPGKEVPVSNIKSVLGAQSGQATTEYSMILLIVCLVALALGAFVKGGGFDGLFQDLVKAIQDRFAG
jgi:hypothetical protein